MAASDVPRRLFEVAAILFILAGGGHGIAALVDVWRPTFFTPTDPSARDAMQRSHVRLRTMFPGGKPRWTLWDAWLGFNLSHSLGAVVFGAFCFALAAHDFAFVAGAGFVMPAAIVVASCYLVLSLRFWFYGPTIPITIGVACFVAAYALV